MYRKTTMARSPSTSSQQKYIISMIKEWSDRLKLAEWKITCEFVSDKNDFTDDNGDRIGLGRMRSYWLKDKERKACDYSVILQFREYYEKEDWNTWYSSLNEMIELTVIHELIHIKMSRYEGVINAHTEGFSDLVGSGWGLQEQEWLVDNLARTMYDLKYGTTK